MRGCRDRGIPQGRRAPHRGVSTMRPATRSRPTAPACILCWGNYEGPHHCDVHASKRHHRRDPHRQAGRPVPRSRQPWRRRPRMDRVRDGRNCRTARCTIPGVLESKTNFIRAPRTDRTAHWPLRQARRPGERDGRKRLRLRYLGRTSRRRPQVVWAKFAAMAEGCRLATREFWGWNGKERFNAKGRKSRRRGREGDYAAAKPSRITKRR